MHMDEGKKDNSFLRKIKISNLNILISDGGEAEKNKIKFFIEL